jgi:hypothetical protein
MKEYKLLIDEQWERALLTENDIKMIQYDIDGILQRGHVIKLKNGECIDTGIIDDILLSIK